MLILFIYLDDAEFFIITGSTKLNKREGPDPSMRMEYYLINILGLWFRNFLLCLLMDVAPFIKQRLMRWIKIVHMMAPRPTRGFSSPFGCFSMGTGVLKLCKVCLALQIRWMTSISSTRSRSILSTLDCIAIEYVMKLTVKSVQRKGYVIAVLSSRISIAFSVFDSLKFLNL